MSDLDKLLGQYGAAPPRPNDTLSQGPEPSGYDRVFDTIYGWLGGKPENRWAAEKLATAFDFGTLGMATGAYDGGQALAQGKGPGYLAAAVMPGAKPVGAAATAVAKAAAPVARDAVQGIRAYHASPHDFDKFSMDKVGTGIGAKTEGHGLYMTTSEKLADYYKNDMPRGGFKYEVLINSTPDKFLDWDGMMPEVQKILSTKDGIQHAKKAGYDGVVARNTGAGYEGTANYTVFDAALIEIIRKYGIAGLLAAAYGGTPSEADAKGPQLPRD